MAEEAASNQLGRFTGGKNPVTTPKSQRGNRPFKIRGNITTIWGSIKIEFVLEFW